MLKTFSVLFLTTLTLVSCDQYRLADEGSADLSAYSLQNCTYVRNASGQIVSWKSLVPIDFSLTSHIPEQWRSAIKDAATVWVTPLGVQLIRIRDEISSSENYSNDKKNNIYWVDNGSLFNYQQAQTITRWNKNQIQDADILINSKDFSFFTQVPENNNKVHLKSLLVHEFGHALGLAHIKVMQSVMYPELSYSQIRVDLSDLDKTSMNCEYK